MQLFSKNKSTGVRSFMLNLVNNNCPDLQFNVDDARTENRVRMCVVTVVVPLDAGQPRFENQFGAVTKEVSTSGLSLVLDSPRGLDEMILAFRRDQSMVFLRGRSRHLSPMGAGFFQLGVELVKVIHVSDAPGLEHVTF